MKKLLFEIKNLFGERNFKEKKSSEIYTSVLGMDKKIKKLYDKLNLEIGNRETYNGKLFYIKENKKINVCNFIIEPKCIINYYNKYSILEKKVFIKIYDLHYGFIKSICIDYNIFENEKWIKDYMSSNKFEIYDKSKFEELKKAIYDYVYKSKGILYVDENNTGWYKVKKNKWSYFFPNYKYYKGLLKEENSRKYLLNNINDAFKKYLDIAPKTVTIPIFAYSILSILNGLFKEVNIQPNFIMLLIGKKEDNIFGLSSLFGNIFHNVDNRLYDYKSGGYLEDSIEDLFEKSTMHKDSLMLIDGIYSGDDKKLKYIKDKFMKYYIKRDYVFTKNKNNYRLNRLPLIICEKNIYSNDKLFLKVNIENSGIDNKKLSEFIAGDADNLKELFYCLVLYLSKFAYRWKFKYIKNYFFNMKRELFYSNINLDERNSEILVWLLMSYGLFLEFLYNNKLIDNFQLKDSYEEAKLNIFGNLDINKNIESNIICEIQKIESNDTNELLKFIYEIYCKDKDRYFIEADEAKNEETLDEDYIGWIKKNKKEQDEIYLIFNNESSFKKYKKLYNSKGDNKISIDYDNFNENLKALSILKITKSEKKRAKYSLKLNRDLDKKRYMAISVNKLEEYLKSL